MRAKRHWLIPKDCLCPHDDRGYRIALRTTCPVHGIKQRESAERPSVELSPDTREEQRENA